MARKRKGVTVAALDYSRKVCDTHPELLDRTEVRRLIVNAYRSGHSQAKKEATHLMIEASMLNLTDIDYPVFTHTKEFADHFAYIMQKVKNILFMTPI